MKTQTRTLDRDNFHHFPTVQRWVCQVIPGMDDVRWVYLVHNGHAASNPIRTPLLVGCLNGNLLDHDTAGSGVTGAGHRILVADVNVLYGHL